MPVDTLSAPAVAATEEVPPLRFALPPHPTLRAVVIIPARNEAADLPATLAALVAQTCLVGQPLPPADFEILVLANNCTDATAAVVRAFAAGHPAWAIQVQERILPPAEAHVGRARRLLLDEASRRLRLVGRPCGLLLSTDADTQPAPTWLAATAAAIAAGADAVGGRILPRHSGAASCAVRRQHLQDAAYHLARTQLEAYLNPLPHDPWPRHHQHFGGSLALTAAAYEQVGGLPVVPYLEDEALYQALLRHDLRVRHCPQVRVVTSDRRVGRVAVGLSWQLQEWAQQHAEGRPHLVAGVSQLTAEARLRYLLRQAWTTQTLSAELLAHWPGPAAELTAGLRTAPTSGVFLEWAWRHVPQQWPPVPVAQAVAELRAYLKQLIQPFSPANPTGR